MISLTKCPVFKALILPLAYDERGFYVAIDILNKS